MIELNQCKANSSMCSWISLNFNVSFPDLNDATTINNRFCGYTSRIYPLQGQSSKAEASTLHTHPPNKHRLPPATWFPSGLRASSELPLLALQMSYQFMPYPEQQTCWALNLVDAICLHRSNFHVVHAPFDTIFIDFASPSTATWIFLSEKELLHRRQLLQTEGQASALGAAVASPGVNMSLLLDQLLCLNCRVFTWNQERQCCEQSKGMQRTCDVIKWKRTQRYSKSLSDI